MTQATIIIHLPGHRERALQLQTDLFEAEPAYDANIGAYLKFLKDEAAQAGYTLETDNSPLDAAYSIDAQDHDRKKAAHDWLATQPDLWNWIP